MGEKKKKKSAPSSHSIRRGGGIYFSKNDNQPTPQTHIQESSAWGCVPSPPGTQTLGSKIHFIHSFAPFFSKENKNTNFSPTTIHATPPLRLLKNNLICLQMGEEAKKADEMPSQDNKSPGTNDNDTAKEKKDKAEEGSKQGADPHPREIVLKVHMHCEGCARKVRRCLIGFDGVEEVLTDSRANKVVVKGEKADPMKVLERVQRKRGHRHVELLSPIPKPNPPPPPPQEGGKPHPQQQADPPEKKEEPKVVTVVLKVHMHCEACSQEIKKRILRMKGVESVEPDLKRSQVSVKGVFEPAKLVEYVYKRTGKHAAIVEREQEQEPEPKPTQQEEKKKKEGANKEEKEEGAVEEGGKKEEEEKKAGGGEEGEGKGKEKEGESAGTGEEELVEMMVGMELKKKENLYYPPYYMPRFVPMELHGGKQYHQYPNPYPYPYPLVAAAYPPQMFSDDNPNACSVM